MSAREPSLSGESRSVFGWCSSTSEEQHKKCRVQFECWGRTYICSCEKCHPQPELAANQGNQEENTDGHEHRDHEEPREAQLDPA